MEASSEYEILKDDQIKNSVAQMLPPWNIMQNKNRGE
jgi:hypothetical protein